MFCPQCKAEYRQGFTRCADCDIELVHELTANAIVAHERVVPGDSDEDPFCSFWTGDDPRIHAELCELLEKESIPHKTVRREDHLFHISSYPAFQIGIPFSMFERGEAAVKEAYGSGEAIEPISRLLPVESDHIPGTRFDAGAFDPRGGSSQRSTRWSAEPGADESSEELTEPRDSGNSDAERESQGWNADEPATEIWSGDEPELAEFIGASLQTNQIPFRRDARAGMHVVYVHAEDETRAREIVREVVEGVPPE
ncbi:MAG TPA: hypothetical protein VKP61_00360 [Candidatus Acidoferrum sp.]|nr:hypothetical protein [Candidatus Acidoferrum sp.]